MFTTAKAIHFQRVQNVFSDLAWWRRSAKMMENGKPSYLELRVVGLPGDGNCKLLRFSHYGPGMGPLLGGRDDDLFAHST